MNSSRCFPPVTLFPTPGVVVFPHCPLLPGWLASDPPTIKLVLHLQHKVERPAPTLHRPGSSLEKAVETTDGTDDTDGQGLGGSAPPSAESAKSAAK